MRPNFSRVRLKKNLRSHWCVQPFEQKNKSLCDSESLSAVRQQTRLNQSEIVKGGLAVVQIFMFVCVRMKMHVLLQSDREREVSSRDARSSFL